MNREEIKYTATVNAAGWLVTRADIIAKRIEGLSSKERHAVENEIVWIGRRLYDRVRKGGEQ
jgi:hypothetical protein